MRTEEKHSQATERPSLPTTLTPDLVRRPDTNPTRVHNLSVNPLTQLKSSSPKKYIQPSEGINAQSKDYISSSQASPASSLVPQSNPQQLPSPPISHLSGRLKPSEEEHNISIGAEETATQGQMSSLISTMSDTAQGLQMSDGECSSSVQVTPCLLPPIELQSIVPPLDVQAAELERTLRCLMKERLGNYKQDVYVPPMVKPSLQAADEQLFPLMKRVTDFLDTDGQVMLILGDSGAGKSTFNRYLEDQLWRNYRSGEAIPLLINLPALDRPDKELVAEQLKTLGFSKEQIRVLRPNRQFVLICDGYDESQATFNLHTTNLLNQPGQWSAKLIISCRTQYLGPDYRDRFVPKMVNQYQSAADDLFQGVVIAPFSKDQIETYVERYVPLKPRTWVKKDYMDKLTTIPDLMDLVKNPFLLTLCLEALPSVVQGRNDLSRLRVTRVRLYDTFVKHWLGVNRRRLQDQQLDENNRMALDALLTDGFERNGILYQVDLAAAIFHEQKGRSVVDYSHLRDWQTWKAYFFGPDPERGLLRASSLLNRAGTQHRFIHRSVLEYFYSRTICSPADNTGEFDPHAHPDFADPLTSIATLPLSQRSLVAEQSIVQFLSERVQSNSNFKQHLHDIIELSKTDEQAGQAAANAITILVQAGVHFNGADLRGIRIPGADVSGGQFDSAQLQDSNLAGVNFTKCWIRQVEFSNARMEGVLFGESSYLNENSKVMSCAYSPDGEKFAVGLGDGTINIYSTACWNRTHTYRMDSTSLVISIAFSPTNQQLMIRNSRGKALLWNYETGASGYALVPVTAATFSPCGRRVASSGVDDTLKLRNAQTGVIDPTRTVMKLRNAQTGVIDPDPGLTPMVSSATWVSFSPCGEHIAIGTVGGTVQTFSTNTELFGWILECEHGRVECAIYSPDGLWIVSGHKKGDLQLWETTIGRVGLTWKAHPEGVSGVDFSPDGHWIASCSSEFVVRLWDARTGAALSIFAGHVSNVFGVVFSPSGSQLASCSQDGTVRFWDVSSTRIGLDAHGSTDPVSVVTYSPNGQHLLSGSHNGTVQRHGADTGELDLVLSVGDGQADWVVYSSDGLQFATAGCLGQMTKRDAETGAAERILGVNMRDVHAMAFSRRWIATDNDEVVRLWDASTGEPGRVLAAHTSSITSLAFSPDGENILSASADGSIRIWTVEEGDSELLVEEDSDRMNVAVYSPDGLTIATTSCLHEESQVVQLWNANTHEKLRRRLEHLDRICCLVFSPCSQWIASGCARMVYLWRSSSGSTQSQLGQSDVLAVGGFFGDVKSVAWRPGTETLEFATGCKDGSIRVWRLSEALGYWTAQLIWNSGSFSLTINDAVIMGVQGLSQTNRELFLQRGAKEDNSPSTSGALIFFDEEGEPEGTYEWLVFDREGSPVPSHEANTDGSDWSDVDE